MKIIQYFSDSTKKLTWKFIVSEIVSFLVIFLIGIVARESVIEALIGAVVCCVFFDVLSYLMMRFIKYGGKNGK